MCIGEYGYLVASLIHEHEGMESFRLVGWLDVLGARILVIHIPDDFFLFVVDEDSDYVSLGDGVEGRANRMLKVL